MLGNFIEESANAPGFGDISLNGATTGRVAWGGRFASGAVAYYGMTDGIQTEMAIGTYTTGSPNKIVRPATVLWNSAGTTVPLNFTGAVRVWNAVPAERTPWLDALGNLPLNSKVLYQLAAGTDTHHAVNKAQMDAADAAVRAATVPIGGSIVWSGATLPAGWLWEAGQNVSRTTYSALFAALGTQHGAGDGSTTFTIPDSRGRGDIGRDDMGGTAANRVTAAISGIAGSTLGASGGDERMQAHSHASTAAATVYINDPGHSHIATLKNRAGGSSGGNYLSPDAGSDFSFATTAVGTGITAVATVTMANVSAGAGAAQNMPPSLVRNKIIYAGVV